MLKCAAATALAITLITMLALAVSASLTPANARGIFCASPQAALKCGCQAIRDYAHAAAGTLPALKKKEQACEAKWGNALEASRGIDGRIDGALAWRIFSGVRSGSSHPRPRPNRHP
jgi:hypothetical protein